MLRRLNLLRAIYGLTIALYVPLAYALWKLVFSNFSLRGMPSNEAPIFFSFMVLGFFPLVFCTYMLILLARHYPDAGLSPGQSSTIIIGFCVLLLSTAVLGVISGAFINSTFPINSSKWKHSGLLEILMGFNFCLLAPACLICAIISLRIRNFILRNNKERLMHAFD